MKVILLRLSLVLLVLSTASSSNAQTKELFAQQIENRATNVINETMAKVGERVEDFNRRMSAIYALMPLEAANLEHQQIQSNIKEIEGFVAFIDNYRKDAKALSKVLTDSISSLRGELPVSQRRTFLISFEKAYHNDGAAFDKYLGSLSKLFRRVNTTLEFMLAAKFTVEASTVHFEDKNEHARHSKLMETVNEANAEVSKAARESKEATIEANKVMQETYGQK